MPAAGGATFTIGSDGFTASAFRIDELRISNIEQPSAVIQYDADRSLSEVKEI
jgi:hypothetical protein